MKVKQFDSLGLKWNILVPENATEYNGLCKTRTAKGEADPLLADGISKTVFHVTLGDIRSTLCDVIADNWVGEDGKPISRGSGKFEEDDKGNKVEIQLNESSYARKAMTEAKKSKEDLANLQVEVYKALSDGASATEVQMDPDTSVKGPPKPKKLPEEFLVNATALIGKQGQTLPDGRRVDVVALATKLHSLFPDTTAAAINPANGLPTAESLGWLIRAFELDRRRKQAAELANTVVADLS